MPAGAMNVTMRDFFCRCRPQIEDFYIKFQVLPGQRVVGIDIGVMAPCLDDSDGPHPLGGIQLHDVTRLQFAFESEVFDRHALDFSRVARAKCFRGLETGSENIARLPAGQRGFQAADEVTCTVQVHIRLGPARRLQLRAGLVAQGVVETYDGSGLNFHVTVSCGLYSRQFEAGKIPQQRPTAKQYSHRHTTIAPVTYFAVAAD